MTDAVDLVIPPQRLDSVMQALSQSWLSNSATGMGTGRDSMTQTRVGYGYLLSDAELRSLYRGNWLIRRVVEAPADDMTKAVDIVVHSGSGDRLIRKALQVYQDGSQLDSPYARRLGCDAAIRKALVWARLFGQGYCVMRVNGGEDPALPLTQVKSFEGLSVLDRYSLRPAIGTVNPESPEFYQVARNDAPGGFGGETGQSLGQKIHESRVLVFNGAQIHPWDIQLEGDGGHDSILQQLYDSFVRHAAAKDAIGKGLDSYSLFKVAISGLSTIMQAPGGTAALTEYLNTVAQQMSLHRIVLQDAESSKSEFQERSFAGVEGLFAQLQAELTAACYPLPHYKIWGSVDKSGLADSGGAEAKAYAENINAIQTRDLKDNHRRLFHAIFEAVGKPPKSWDIEYPSIYTPTEQEQWAIAKQQAETLTTLVREGVITATQAYQSLATGQEMTNVLEPLYDADVLTIVDEAEEAGPSAEDELAALLGGGDPGAAPAPGVEPSPGEDVVPPEPDPTQQTDSAADLMEYWLGWRADAPKGGGKGKGKKRTKKPNCKTGRSCGFSCVDMNKACKPDLSPAAKAVAKSINDPFDPAVNPLPRRAAGAGGGAGGQGQPQGAAQGQRARPQQDPFAPANNPLPQRAAATAQRYQIPDAKEAIRTMPTLGKGAFGVVVLDKANNVAVKYSTAPGVPPVNRSELQAMQIASKLGIGPRVIAANRQGLAMEALTDYKSTGSVRRLDVESQKQVARNMLSSMAKMHSERLVHGDIHSGNVLFNPKTLDVKFIDFAEATPNAFRMGLDMKHLATWDGPVWGNSAVKDAINAASRDFESPDRVNDIYASINRAIDEVR